VACPLQRHHRSRGLRFRRAPLGFQLPRDPSRRPSTSSVRCVAEYFAFGLCAQPGEHFSSALRSPRVLVSICGCSPLQRMTRGRPILIQPEAHRLARAQYVLPPLMRFLSPRTVRSALAGRRSTSRSVRGALVAAAACIDWKQVSDARPPLLPPRVARCDLGSRIASSRALATNAVPFAQTSPTNTTVLPNPCDAARGRPPLQGLSPPGATDRSPPPPSCFALHPSTEAEDKTPHLGVLTLHQVARDEPPS
jgi:hypothetical protein